MCEDKIKSNSEGKLWIETKDFFSCPTVKKMIEELNNSKLRKDIDERNDRIHR
jgi:hypothetical protein